MIDDVFCDRLETIVALYYLDFSREFLFQLFLLGVIQIFVFEDFVKFITQVLVLNKHLWDTLLIEERHRRAVIHRLLEVVLRNIIAEPGIGFAFAPEQWSSGERHVLRIRQAMSHVFGKRLVLCAVCFIYHHHNIVAVRHKWVFLALWPAELLDEREHKALVLAKKLAHFLAILGLRRVAFLNRLSVQEVTVDLTIQVFAIGYHHEREVTDERPEYFAHKEDHRKALA